MRHSFRKQKPLFAIALAILALRALTPDGYMPGSRDSGLLFELCPSGMPVEVIPAPCGTRDTAIQEKTDENQNSGTLRVERA